MGRPSNLSSSCCLFVCLCVSVCLSVCLCPSGPIPLSSWNLSLLPSFTLPHFLTARNPTLSLALLRNPLFSLSSSSPPPHIFPLPPSSLPLYSLPFVFFLLPPQVLLSFPFSPFYVFLPSSSFSVPLSLAFTCFLLSFSCLCSSPSSSSSVPPPHPAAFLLHSSIGLLVLGPRSIRPSEDHLKRTSSISEPGSLADSVVPPSIHHRTASHRVHREIFPLINSWWPKELIAKVDWPPNGRTDGRGLQGRGEASGGSTCRLGLPKTNDRCP